MIHQQEPWSGAAILWCFALVVIGVVVRIMIYLPSTSLGLDESMLALNLIHRSYAELMQPLNWNQEAPIGFLIVVRAFLEWFGNTEHVLRAIPFIAALAALPLFCVFGRRCLSGRATVIGLAVLVFCVPVLQFSGQIKQYSVDLLMTVAILVVALSVSKRNRSFVTFAIFALFGIVSIWLSYSSVLVLAGVGTILIGHSFLTGQRGRAVLHVCVAATWFLSFVVCYIVVIRHRMGTDALSEAWEFAFMPFPPLSVDDLRWYVGHLLWTFNEPVGIELRGIAAVAFVAGAIGLFHRNRLLFLLLVAPLVVSLIASAFHVYPYGGRVSLYIVPLYAAVIGFGCDWLIKSANGPGRIVGWVLVALLLLYPVRNSVEYLRWLPKGHEMKTVVQHIHMNSQPDDLVFLYWGAHPTFEYYSDVLEWHDVKSLVGKDHGDNWSAFRDDLSKLSGRVWFIVPHVGRRRLADEELIYLLILDELGTRIDSIVAYDTAAYLYDLR